MASSEVDFKVPSGLRRRDVQQVLGYLRLQLTAGQGQRRRDAPEEGAARTEGTLSLRVGCGVHWEELLFSGGHLALLTFICLPTSLGTSFPSDHSFSKCFAGSSSSFPKMWRSQVISPPGLPPVRPSKLYLRSRILT